MNRLKSIRKRAIVRGWGDSTTIVLFIIGFGYTAYFILFFQDCVKSQDCDFTKFGSLSDPLVVTIIGVALVIGLPPVQYVLQKIKRDIEDPERCAELKGQLDALKTDYELMKSVPDSSIAAIINQKNTRLIIINNLVDLLRHHYSEKLSRDLSIICEKGIRFPVSIAESSRDDFEYECNMFMPVIVNVLLQLNEKPHDKHSFDGGKSLNSIHPSDNL